MSTVTMKTLLVLFAVVILSSTVTQVNSVCCCRCSNPAINNDLYCRCKHDVEHSYCNGVRGCNAACCNCDGGCWKDVVNGPANATVVEPKVRFAEFDTDTDGFISMEDILGAFSGLTAGNDTATARQQFATMDDDGDGKLSYREFEKHA